MVFENQYFIVSIYLNFFVFKPSSEPETVHFKISKKPVSNIKTFSLEDADKQKVDFIAEAVNFTLVTKIKGVRKNLKANLFELEEDFNLQPYPLG